MTAVKPRQYAICEVSRGRSDLHVKTKFKYYFGNGNLPSHHDRTWPRRVFHPSTPQAVCPFANSKTS